MGFFIRMIAPPNGITLPLLRFHTPQGILAIRTCTTYFCTKISVCLRFFAILGKENKPLTLIGNTLSHRNSKKVQFRQYAPDFVIENNLYYSAHKDNSYL